MNRWASLGIVIAVAIGALLPLQALINARLGAQTQGPLYASFVSFLVGICVLGVLLLATRTPLAPGAPVASLPGWIWMGGVIGAHHVKSAISEAIAHGANVCRRTQRRIDLINSVTS